MSTTDVLSDALDALDTDQRSTGTSILLGYLWSAASPETRVAALAAMRRNIR